MSLVADVGTRNGELSLEVAIRAGSDRVVAVIGPNGAGKTTLLRALAGLVRLDRGRVELDGEVLEDVAAGRRREPERRSVALVFQDLLLFPHLSALDNVAFGLRARGMRAARARAEAGEWLERLGVAGQGSRRPRRLSGGEAQRVALARALVTRPRLLLLDEPLASVDASARVDLRRTLRQHLAEHGGVRLLVTHDPLEAAALADQVVVLEAGRVAQAGSFLEVTARPRTDWVARIAGLNLLRGDAAGGELRLPGGRRVSIVGGLRGPALATVHPRAVALHRGPPAGSPRNVLRGAAVDIDREGDRVRVRVEGDVQLVAEVTAAAAAELRLAEGGEVFAAVKATEIDVYPD